MGRYGEDDIMRIKRLLPAMLLSVALAFAAGNVHAGDVNDGLTLLKEGNARFVKMEMRYPNVNAERRTDTAVKGQEPFAIVLACSDSRVPVEEIFDRGIGDIFVVRVAGNIAIDPGIIGSVEYAAGHLNIPLLVILGHTDCGAVKASVGGPPLEGNIRSIQETIEVVAQRVKKDHPELQGTELILAVVKANILEAKKDLLSKSEEISRLAREGKLKIVTAMYDLETGAVEWMSGEAGRVNGELVDR